MSRTTFSTPRPATSLVGIVLLVGIISFGGCVYFNTFYNAKKAFNTAENVRKSAGARAQGVGAGDYRKAIEKALKVIENYPKSKY